MPASYQNSRSNSMSWPGRQCPQFARKRVPYGGRILAFSGISCVNRVVRAPQRAERRGIGMAHERVPLPMPRHRTIRDLYGPLVDTDEVPWIGRDDSRTLRGRRNRCRRWR